MRLRTRVIAFILAALVILTALPLHLLASGNPGAAGDGRGDETGGRNIDGPVGVVSFLGRM